jgi:hypothetical protein
VAAAAFPKNQYLQKLLVAASDVSYMRLLRSRLRQQIQSLSQRVQEMAEQG